MEKVELLNVEGFLVCFFRLIFKVNLWILSWIIVMFKIIICIKVKYFIYLSIYNCCFKFRIFFFKFISILEKFYFVYE